MMKQQTESLYYADTICTFYKCCIIIFLYFDVFNAFLILLLITVPFINQLFSWHQCLGATIKLLAVIQ